MYSLTACDTIELTFSYTFVPSVNKKERNVPDGSQTRGLRLRRPTLYSTELQAQILS